MNDWSAERWLTRDARLYSSIMVGSQLPDVAAAEVRRHAQNARMVQVMLVDNPFNRGFGHPVFHPIYDRIPHGTKFVPLLLNQAGRAGEIVELAGGRGVSA